MHYTEIQVPGSLRKHVSCYWKFEVGELPEGRSSIQHHVLPDGCISVCYIYSKSAGLIGPVLMGPRTEVFQTTIYPYSVAIGIRFMPGAFKIILNRDFSRIRNQVLPAGELTPEFANPKIVNAIRLDFNDFSIFDGLLNAILDQSTVSFPDRICTAVKLVLKHKGNVKIEKLARSVHWGLRHFQRQFKWYTGLTPKEFVKIIRLRESFIRILLDDESLHDTLFDAGYYDQSHFNRDFAMVSGLKPTQFLNYVRQIKHGKFSPE